MNYVVVGYFFYFCLGKKDCYLFATVFLLTNGGEEHKSSLTMLEICKKEIGSIMASLASMDMEEVSKQMEESEFATTDLESELQLRFTIIIFKLFYVDIYLKYFLFFLQGRRGEETKTSFEDS